MARSGAELRGLNRLLRQMQNFGEEGTRTAGMVVQSTADLVVAEAKQNAPGDLGKLKQEIGKDELNNKLSAAIFCNAPHAPYVEFGTGAHVSVPAELQEIASKFKGKGNGSWNDFKKAITGWMSRKGIDEKYAYVIMLNILHNGVRPQPFLYPAYLKGKQELPRKLELALNRLIRQTNNQ